MLTADFQQFYGLDLADLWRGALSTRRVLILSEHLLDIPDSRYRAARLGGPQFLGWDDDRYLAADHRDLLLWIASGLSGEKVEAEELYPRPKGEVSDPEQPQTIAEFDIPGFLRKLTT